CACSRCRAKAANHASCRLARQCSSPTDPAAGASSHGPPSKQHTGNDIGEEPQGICGSMPAGDGDWRRLIKLQGNPSRPMWIAGRIYFISDHGGVGNLYSCDPSGQNLRQHTEHDDFYVRGAGCDGKRIVAVSDAEGCEGLVILHTDEIKAPEHVTGMDLSRVVSMKVSPKVDQVAIANVKNELILVDLPTKAWQVLDRSEHAPLWGLSFSPDGKWIAYEWSATLHTSIIKLVSLK